MHSTRNAILFLVLASRMMFAASGPGAVARFYPLTVLSDNPSAYWRFNELSGNLAHDQVGGHDCLLTNVQLGVAGYSATDPDTAAAFGLLASSNSYAGELDQSTNGFPNLDFARPPGSNAEFSVEAWVRGGPQNVNAGIIAKGYGNGGEQFSLDTGSDTITNHGFRFSIHDAAGLSHAAASAAVPDGQWHHLVGVCDEPQGEVRLYLDGIEITNGAVPAAAGILTASGGSAPGTDLVSIGSRTASQTATSFNNQFVGTLDEVAVYGYALSPAQVAAHYQAGLTSLRFTNVSVRAASIVLKGTGGLSNAPCVLVTSTNPALSLAQWSAVLTGWCDAGGSFSLTDPVTSAQGQFYALQGSLASADLWIPPCGAWLGAEVTNSIGGHDYTNEEANLGRPLDILRAYHTLSNWTNLNPSELSYLNAGRKIFASFKPDPYWSNAVGTAYGGSPTVDAELASVAQSVASVKPRKLMLCVWHEPQNDLGIAGTTNEYVAMWHNVRTIFDANGATNVLWVWVIQSGPTYRPPLAGLWPGNSYVDWVGWDNYQGTSNVDFVNKQLDMYYWMLNNSTEENNYSSKPWCWPEWGVGINGWFPSVADQTNTFNAINAAFNQRLFPRVRYAAYFDTDSGPNAASAILPGAWGAYSNLANSPYFLQQAGP